MRDCRRDVRREAWAKTSSSPPLISGDPCAGCRAYGGFPSWARRHSALACRQCRICNTPSLHRDPSRCPRRLKLGSAPLFFPRPWLPKSELLHRFHLSSPPKNHHLRIATPRPVFPNPHNHHHPPPSRICPFAQLLGLKRSRRRSCDDGSGHYKGIHQSNICRPQIATAKAAPSVMDHHMGGFHPSMAQPPPPLMNQPPQIFGDAYHGMPMQHLPPELTAQMFGDPGALLDDANEAKRRRIARVSLPAPSAPRSSLCLSTQSRNQPLTVPIRPAICAGKRKSNVTANCQLARTA